MTDPEQDPYFRIMDSYLYPGDHLLWIHGSGILFIRDIMGEMSIKITFFFGSDNQFLAFRQCCGSGVVIPDPIFPFRIPDPGQKDSGIPDPYPYQRI
jgi:hypothetical protein